MWQTPEDMYLIDLIHTKQNTHNIISHSLSNTVDILVLRYAI